MSCFTVSHSRSDMFAICINELHIHMQVGDMEKLGIFESFKVKQAILLSATEAAEMILRVDDIITCAPRKREDRM